MDQNNQILNMNIAVTNRCNLRCRQCSIWREDPKEDLSLENIESIIGSAALSNDADIALTGGEPFLHRDFMNIVDGISKKRPGRLKVISTNGTLKDAMLDLLGKHGAALAGCSFHISFDGVTKHDEQRGSSGKMILNNIMAIQRDFPDTRIKLKFTITKINYEDILPTYEYAKRNSLGFKIKLVEDAVNYTNRVSFREPMDDFILKEKKVIARDLLSVYHDLKKTNQKDAAFINETIKILLGKKSFSLCRTPFDRIFVMPDGKVYSCIHFNSIGNINDKRLDEIWRSDEAGLIRSVIRKEGCGRCVAFHGFSLPQA
ncbi:MAG: radical SAM protein [Candidatus Omnitrophota bacterium]